VSRRYPVPIDGFRQRPIALETEGLLSGARLLQNGERAPKGPKRGTFTLIRDDGSEAVARVRPASFFVDPVPSVQIGDQQIRVVRPFQWYEMTWLALPILLVFVGGAIGAGVGIAAAAVNATIMRSDRPWPLRYVQTGGVSILAVVAYVVLAVIFLRTIGR
jgi:hypothetical protein